MKFEINGIGYIIIEEDMETIKNISNKMFYKKNDSNYYYGLADFRTNIVYINKYISKNMKIKTLKHELTHVWLLHTANCYTSYSEEDVCNIVSDCNEFINTVIDKYKKKIIK